MSRKSRIEPVREFLKAEIVQAKLDQDRMAVLEDYQEAAVIKKYKDVLVRALELCGEERSKENKVES